MARSFLAIPDFTEEQIYDCFNLAIDLKRRRMVYEKYDVFRGRAVALVFAKQSLRTRLSFEIGVTELGGYPLYVTDAEIGMGKRESVYDVANVLSRYVALIEIRWFSHEEVEELARCASVPVVNGLTDLLHPCQIMGDLLTIMEKKRHVDGIRVAFLGDGNNVANSWIEAAQMLPLDLRIGTNPACNPDVNLLERARAAGKSQILITEDPFEAVKDADVVYTDVWASMGQKHLTEEKNELLKTFQVNAKLMSHARKDALIMHCLPANRGLEITDECMDGPNSVIFDQAENRLHIQKAIMAMCMTL